MGKQACFYYIFTVFFFFLIRVDSPIHWIMPLPWDGNKCPGAVCDFRVSVLRRCCLGSDGAERRRWSTNITACVGSHALWRTLTKKLQYWAVRTKSMWRLWGTINVYQLGFLKTHWRVHRRVLYFNIIRNTVVVSGSETTELALSGAPCLLN